MAGHGRSAGIGVQNSDRWWRPRVSVELLIALVSGYFVLVCNGPLWAAVRAGTGSVPVLLSLGVAVFALHAVLLGLLCWGVGSPHPTTPTPAPRTTAASGTR